MKITRIPPSKTINYSIYAENYSSEAGNNVSIYDNLRITDNLEWTLSQEGISCSDTLYVDIATGCDCRPVTYDFFSFEYYKVVKEITYATDSFSWIMTKNIVDSIAISEELSKSFSGNEELEQSFACYDEVTWEFLDTSVCQLEDSKILIDSTILDCPT